MDVVEKVNVLSLLLIGVFNQLCSGGVYCSALSLHCASLLFFL